MKVYHQAAHNTIWNINSHMEDKTGDGIIFSPKNIKYEKLNDDYSDIKKNSFFDPQLYNPKDAVNKMNTYPFHPSKRNNFTTGDFKDYIENGDLINFQINNDFEYIVIPSYYKPNMDITYYINHEDLIIKPSFKVLNKNQSQKPILLTLILQEKQIRIDELVEEILDWITKINDISGIYLILDYSTRTTKQIKDEKFLMNVLKIIYVLTEFNELEVHIGYNNTEGILYSLANPTSISMGSYENSRMFNYDNFIPKGKRQIHQPKARFYSKFLFQWIPVPFFDQINNKMPKEIQTLFNFSNSNKYNLINFEERNNWNLQNPNPYKHYFLEFSNQVKELPQSLEMRINFLEEQINIAINKFERLEEFIAFDDNSDKKHLLIWLKVIKSFKNYIKGV